MRIKQRFIQFVTCLGLVLIASPAMAKEKKNPLEGTPAVRHRLELRKGRFEVGPSIAFTLNRAVRDSVLFGLKLEYHMFDTLSIGAEVAGGVSYNTGLANELKDSYEEAGNLTKDPSEGQGLSWEKLEKRMSDIVMAGDIRLTWTPIYGRIAIFSKLFMLYDFYIFGGFGMAVTKNRGDPAEFGNAAVDDANEGFRPGLTLPGLGLRVYINNFVALGFEVKNIMFEDNETGSDQTRGLEDDEIAQFNACSNKGSTGCVPYLINADDRTFSMHWLLGVNATFFFPMQPKISR